MFSPDMEITAFRHQDPFRFGVSLHARIDRPGLNNGIAGPLMFTEHKVGEFCEPVVTLNEDQSQHLIDALWDCGLRPSEGSGTAGALAATERNLNDMRKVAFNALKMRELL